MPYPRHSDTVNGEQMQVIRVIGSGLLGRLHITLEASEHLMATRKALCLGTNFGIMPWLQQNGVYAENVNYLYVDGARDDDNYARIIGKIYSDLALFGDVTLIVPGHPRVGVSIVQTLSTDVVKGQFELYVVPGVSSFDSLINDINLDPLEDGTCMVDANRLILYDHAMETALNYCVYHVSSIGNVMTDFRDPVPRNQAHLLGRKLRKHYSEEHKVMLVTSAQHVNEASRVDHGDIGTLETLLEDVTFSTTLFIPASNPTHLDRAFMEVLGVYKK